LRKKALQERMALPEQQVQLVLSDRKEFREYPEPRVRQVQPDRLARQARQALLVLLDPQEQPALLEPREPLARQVQPEQLVQQVNRLFSKEPGGLRRLTRLGKPSSSRDQVTSLWLTPTPDINPTQM
jgi:hypothetical protein